MIEPAPWPLTAAGTHVLRHLREAKGGEVLVLGLRELVLRRVWRLERRERAGLLGFRSEPTITRAAERPPAVTPLMQLDAALGAAVGPETVAVKQAVKRLVRQRSGRGDALLELTRDDLVRRDLITVSTERVLRILPRTRIATTAEGAALARRSWIQEDALREALRDPFRAPGAIEAAGVLALLSGPAELKELEAELRARSSASGAPVADGGGSPVVEDERSLLDALDPGIDAAVDAGGGGGDGGDGGGDGGGGD